MASSAVRISPGYRCGHSPRGSLTPVPSGAAVLAEADASLDDVLDDALDPPSSVEVEVGERTVRVSDRGAGVAPQEREHVFDRFYRADEARGRPGSGLGLAIVAQIAEVHGGSARLEPRPGGGTVAVLELGPAS